MASDPSPIEPSDRLPVHDSLASDVTADAVSADVRATGGVDPRGFPSDAATTTVADASTRQPAAAPDRVRAAAPDPRTGGTPEQVQLEAPDPATESATGPVSDRALQDTSLVVAMQEVSRTFEDREVLSGVNLTVPRGTILGIIGPSGAGKTTTIRMLTGALEATTGEVSVLGKDPKRFRRVDRERIGYMPQQFTLYEDLTAGENVDFVASLFGMLFRRRRRRVKEVLHVVDLWEARGRRAGRLSGGMQRRLELACALVHEPELIILDEPTAGIDPLLRGTIWEELHRLRDAGRTLLVTTQHVAEADECDSVAMIVGGRIIALAAPDDLRRLATNGDLLDIETASVYDGSNLVGEEGVQEVTQDGPRHLRVVVTDAGSALPVVVEKIKSSGTEVDSAREHRLSFDEIFAILVARDKAERAAAGDPVDESDAAA
jgi:ABC-2 type transport system ATP-binding protein